MLGAAEGLLLGGLLGDSLGEDEGRAVPGPVPPPFVGCLVVGCELLGDAVGAPMPPFTGGSVKAGGSVVAGGIVKTGGNVKTGAVVGRLVGHIVVGAGLGAGLIGARVSLAHSCPEVSTEKHRTGQQVPVGDTIR